MPLVPSSWGSARLAEFNPCHGPQDGKFCTTTGSALPYGDMALAAKQALGKLSRWLYRASLFDGPREGWRETASIVSAGGDRGRVITGEKDSVTITGLTEDMRKFYAAGGRDTAMVHTHPSSSAFSFSDLAGLASLNNEALGVAGKGRTLTPYEQMSAEFLGQPTASVPTGVLAAPRSIVFGQDGSTYELRLKRRLTQMEVVTLEYAYQDIRDAMVPTFQRTVEVWVQKLPGSPFVWQPSPHPAGAPRLVYRGDAVVAGVSRREYPASQSIVTKFAEGADAVGFERVRRREWKRASVAIWRELQREYPTLFEFRYKLEDM